MITPVLFVGGWVGAWISGAEGAEGAIYGGVTLLIGLGIFAIEARRGAAKADRESE